MEYIQEQFESDPQVTILALEFKKIADLAPLLPLLSKFPNLQEIQLYGNRLKNLPRDMSMLRQLQSIDISNNLIDAEDLSEVLPGLQSLPKLKHLTLSLTNEQQGDFIVQALPYLESLNGEQLAGEEPQKEQSTDEAVTQIKQEDLEHIATIYDAIRQLRKETKPEKDRDLAQQFDQKLRSVMADLKQQLKSKFIVQQHILQAKYKLYEHCFDKIIEIISEKDQKSGQILKQLFQAYNKMFSEVPQIIAKIQPFYNQQIDQLKNDMDKAVRETAEVLEAAEHLEQEALSHQAEKEQMKAEFQSQKQDMINEINQLQLENKKYLDMIIKISKQNAENALNEIQEATWQVRNETKNGKQINQQNNSALMQSQHQISQQQISASHNLSKSVINTRVLTLKQLRDVVDEIYISKVKFDQKCAESGQPRETMEQHMYTFLNTNLEDNDVAVFGKILRNECDEEFRFVQKQVKETITELVKVHLKAKFPLKTNADIQNQLSQKQQDIVQYMYNEEDSNILINKIQENIQIRLSQEEQLEGIQQGTRRRNDQRPKPKLQIGFQEFQKILLDFQLKGHEKFLNKFIGIFRRVDQDNNGVINEVNFYSQEEFSELFKSMDICENEEEEIARLLQIVDPQNNQQITFSECVALFSSVSNDIQEMVPVANDKVVSILQKLSQS